MPDINSNEMNSIGQNISDLINNKSEAGTVADETLEYKEEFYDVSKYKEEIGSFIKRKRYELDTLSEMQDTYEKLYSSVYAGTVTSDEERYPHTAEMFKVYKSAIIESSLSGYSALLEISGRDAYSTLKVPELKDIMTNQFKRMSLLEKLSGDTVDDWLLKGEAVSFIKLKKTREEYRTKSTLVDAETGRDVASFKIKEFVSYEDIDIERIDPLDFYVDAYDYKNDPRGSAKIVRTWISSKELLTSNAYPFLTQEDKDDIIASVGRNGSGYNFQYDATMSSTNQLRNKTDVNKIEVLTYYGDYITADNKVLRNIKAVLVGGRIADAKYSAVNTNRIIYAPYKIDDRTHRGVSPLCCTEVVNRLANRVTDMFIKNLDDASNPIMLYVKGCLDANQVKEVRTKRQCEYNDVAQPPTFYAPPVAATQGLQLIQMILEQNKNVLGLNKYLAGNTDGAVRTARESSILFQKANARMRVETDVFSYNYMLSLFVAFYAFNRELALSLEQPLEEIYTDKQLKVSISTNASRADKEGELQRLMQMLQLPIAQMIFSNLQPEQVVLAVRYLMAKAELTDADNLLELMDNSQSPEQGPPPEVQQVLSQMPPEMQQEVAQRANQIMQAQQQQGQQQ